MERQRHTQKVRRGQGYLCQKESNHGPKKPERMDSLRERGVEIYREKKIRQTERKLNWR